MPKQTEPEKEHVPFAESIPASPATLTDAHLRTMTTEDLVKLLKRPDLMQPANVHLRQQIIMLLQEREGNEFVRNALGESPSQTTNKT